MQAYDSIIMDSQMILTAFKCQSSFENPQPNHLCLGGVSMQAAGKLAPKSHAGD